MGDIYTSIFVIENLTILLIHKVTENLINNDFCFIHQICKNTNDTAITELSKEIETSCDTAKAEENILKKAKNACNTGNA